MATATVTLGLAVTTATFSNLPSSLPSGTVGVPYGPVTFIASGGTAPYTFSANNTLPNGLIISVGGGVLSGTPVPGSQGTYAPSFGVKDANGISAATGPIPLAINPALIIQSLQITSLIPNSAVAGGPTFTLRVNGAGFGSGAVVQWNGSPLSTSFVSATQLTATVPASLITGAGTVTITVVSAGLTSNGLIFIISGAFLSFCDLNGDGVVNSIDVQLAGNQALGIAPCTNGDLNRDGVCNVLDVQLVTNAALGLGCRVGPGGPTTINSLTPAMVNAGSQRFTLTVDGTDFFQGGTQAAVVLWNGSPLATTFIDATQFAAQLTASVPANLISTAGTATVTVISGGMTSNGASVTIAAGLAISSLSPSPTTAGGPTFTLTVNGTGFALGAVVQWNGSPLSTTFVSSTQLTASVPGSLITTAGTATVTVTSGGVTSSGSTFTIAAGPVISTLSPTATTAGGLTFTLTVNGTGFASGAVVQWNGSPLSTSFVSATQLTATVPSSLIITAGTATVTVVSGGATSIGSTFTIAAGPVISTLSPNSTAAGGPAFTLTVNGTGFASGAVVQWNGSPLSTTFVSSTQLTASVPASLIAAQGTATVTVTSGSVTSNGLSLTIANGLVISSLSPNAATAGGPTFTLTVNGTGFGSGAVVQWNGSPLSTTFVSATQLTASVPASLITTAGTATVAVTSGGVTSSGSTFTIASAVTLAIIATSLPRGLINVPYPATALQAQGGTGPYRWTAAGLPVGLTLNAAGVFSGTPTTAGTSNVTITVTDTLGQSSPPANFTLTIAPPITISALSLGTVSASADQHTVVLSLSNPPPSQITGTLSLDFALDPSVTNVPSGYRDPAAVFSNGQTSLAFTVDANSNLANMFDHFTTVRSGYGPGGRSDNHPRKCPNFKCHAAGAQLQGATVTVPFNGLDQTQWFGTPGSRQYGGNVFLQIPFAYTGDPAALGSVTVTLTNSKGPSAPVSGGR
jgi:hypothetical protein